MPPVRPRHCSALPASSLAVLLLGCTTSASPRIDTRCEVVAAPSFGPEGGVALKAEVVVGGLEVPWSMAFLPTGELLFTERPGRIRLAIGSALTPPVAVLPVAAEGEGGLLGIALDPDFAANRLFYVYATMPRDHGVENRVERYRLAADQKSAELDRVILAGLPAARFHDGGRLRFGPDGMLYVGVGDAQAPELARDQASLSGKILRVTRDGEVPPDNPTGSSSVFLRGVRNPQAFAFEPGGSILVADHGPSGELGRRGHDELTRAYAGDDLGWPKYWGCETALGVIAPLVVFERAMPPGGAELYQGNGIAGWKGDLLVATLGSKHLHRFVFERDRGRRLVSHELYFQGDPPNGLGRLRDVITGPDGALYVSTSNCDGRGVCPPDGDKIYRITSWSPEPRSSSSP